MNEDAELVLVYDMRLFRPACALLQVVLGGTPGIANQFPAGSWLINSTPGMRAYRVTDAQMREAVTATTQMMEAAK